MVDHALRGGIVGVGAVGAGCPSGCEMPSYGNGVRSWPSSELNVL